LIASIRVCGVTGAVAVNVAATATRHIVDLCATRRGAVTSNALQARLACFAFIARKDTGF
jgi:hypothetical protein